jgi:hypothetical protein
MGTFRSKFEQLIHTKRLSAVYLTTAQIADSVEVRLAQGEAAGEGR